MSSNKQDHYRILGLSIRASEEEIKAQYRKLARQHHPDRFTDPDEKAYGEQRLRELNEAYTAILPPKQLANTDPSDRSPPRPVAIPDRIELGAVELGESTVATFRVENAGGGLESLSFEYNQRNSWFQIIKGTRANPDAPLPMNFTISVDTSNLTPNKTYLDWIDVYISDVSVRVPISLEVIEPKSAVILPRLLVIFGALIIILALIFSQYASSRPTSDRPRPDAQVVIIQTSAPAETAITATTQLDTASLSLSETAVLAQATKAQQEALIQKIVPPTDSTTQPPSQPIARSRLYSTTTFSQSDLDTTQIDAPSAEITATEAISTETITTEVATTEALIQDRGIFESVENVDTDEIDTDEIDTDEIDSSSTIAETNEDLIAGMTTSVRNDDKKLPTPTPKSDAIISDTNTLAESDIIDLDLETTETFESDTPTITSGSDTIDPTESDTTDNPESDISEDDAADNPESDISDVSKLLEAIPTSSVKVLDSSDILPFIPQTQVSGRPATGIYIQVSNDFRVNARVDIDTDSEPLMVLDKLSIHPAVGRTFDNVWTLIILPDNRQAWVFTETILIDTNALNSLPKVIPTSFLSEN